MKYCSPGVYAIPRYSGGNPWDDLLIRLFDQKAYARQFEKSKAVIAKGITPGAGQSVNLGIKF